MDTVEINKKAIKYLPTLSNEEYDKRSTFEDLRAAAESVNLHSGVDSGWYVPQAIKIQGAEGFYFLHQSGQINIECKVIETESGFLVLSMKMPAWNKFENLLRS